MSDHAVQASNTSAAAESHQPSTRPEASLSDAIDTEHESHPPPPSQRLDPLQAGIGKTAARHEPGANNPERIVSDRPTAKSETILQDILDTMYESDIFERARKDAPSRFWSTYERVAKQHDDELIERHSGDLDVLLIFAGLFSAVSSAFIVNMQSSLSPVPSDATNSLLMVLINTINGSMFPAQQASLPVWTGPSSTTIWIQTLAYTSLSSSLLAAFGAVLGKQWLGHFKTMRFGQGALHERCQRRQKKLDALATWHFNTIIATLPILLQMSLLFFGIALAANIWTLQHMVASVIMATTAFGFIFYFFTVVSSLKSPDCPFQTPVSTVLQRVLSVAKSWEGILDRLRKFSKHALSTAKSLISEWMARFSTCLTPMPSTCREAPQSPADPEAAIGLEQLGATGGQMLSFNQFSFSVPGSDAEFQVPLLTADPEAAIGLEQLGATGGQMLSFNQFNFSVPGSDAEFSSVDIVPPHAVQWVLETTTDTEIITAAAGMVPEIEWPARVEVTGALVERLKSGFYACFDSDHQILPLAQAGAVGCLKAMWRLCVERGLDNPFRIYTNGCIQIMGIYYTPLWHMVPDDPGFLVVSSVVDKSRSHLDMTRLPLSDRMWMAHMFTYRLHKGEDSREFDTFVIKFIGICLDSKSPLSPRRLVVDCVLLAGMLVGIQVNRRDLARLDKSQAMQTTEQAVIDSTLGVLLDEIHGRRWHENAQTLIHPLLTCYNTIFSDSRGSARALKFCCSLIVDDSGTLGDDQVRSKSVASLIHIIVRTPWNPSGLCTQEQFDLLVDYHLRMCQGTDDRAICDTFRLLMRLRGSPSTPDRKRRYVNTLTHFMGKESTSHKALCAACVIRSTVASMGRDDESLRQHFSQALTLAVLLLSPQTPTDENPFTYLSWTRDLPYLRLLCALAQEPTWHPQLQLNGHFNNCLAIAKTLSSHVDDDFDNYAVPVVHMFAIIDAVSEELPLFAAAQANSIWPLVLRAWRYMFDLNGGFGGKCGTLIWDISIKECRTALLSLVQYARRRWDESEATSRLIELVDKVFHKLVEEDRQREWDGTQRRQDDPFWPQVLPVLYKQISELLDASRQNV